MSEEIAISVFGVSKKYHLFASPQERLKEALHPFRKRYHREFWALKDISFDVPRGQAVGIIGRNGSGKSTLLQIIASVLQPTTGMVAVNGRVSALLELGAGFNPEFTGRQNVLLSGALMGLSEDEMLRRMPAIEKFADVGDFFEQPTKIYSSGMFVRVAFAAAVHVDPEILVIDEALAVGDAKFQHKCFERFADMQARHKTILFVTHNCSLVTSYCECAYLLDQGRIVASGEPGLVVDKYYKLLFSDSERQVDSCATASLIDTTRDPGRARQGLKDMLEEVGRRDLCSERQSYNKHEVQFGSGAAIVVDYAIQAGELWDVANVPFGSRVCIFLKVVFCQDVDAPVVGFAIKTLEGINLYGTNTFLLGERVQNVKAGEARVFKFEFFMRFKPGDYFLDLGVGEADGTRSGAVITVRRSVAHCVVSLNGECSFEGLVDLAPRFETVIEASKLSPNHYGAA